jgi:hypothetical protein
MISNRRFFTDRRAGRNQPQDCLSPMKLTEPFLAIFNQFLDEQFIL